MNNEQYWRSIRESPGYTQEHLGAQVKFFGSLYVPDDIKVLEKFEVKKADDKKSLQLKLQFNDYSSRIFNPVVAVTIDWGYLQKRRKPLIWLYEDKNDSIYKILFDVNTGYCESNQPKF